MSADPLKPKFEIVLNRYPHPYNPYPREYNPRVHGPYDPSRYYGRIPKQSMWDLKLKDIPNKLLTCDKSPENIGGTISRWLHRYSVRHFRAEKPPCNFLFQIAVVSMSLYYLTSYGFFKSFSNLGGRSTEKRYRFHW